MKKKCHIFYIWVPKIIKLHHFSKFPPKISVFNQFLQNWVDKDKFRYPSHGNKKKVTNVAGKIKNTHLEKVNT